MSKAVPPAEERELEAVAMNIVHQLGDVLYAALPADVAHEHFVTARQKTNDRAIEFAKKLIESFATARVIEELERVKSCFADLQNAEEAVYIESNYIDVRIAQLKETNPHA